MRRPWRLWKSTTVTSVLMEVGDGGETTGGELREGG